MESKKFREVFTKKIAYVKIEEMISRAAAVGNLFLKYGLEVYRWLRNVK